MSKYIKVNDLQKYCDNQKDHAITTNDFQRMNFIELPDNHGRIVDLDKVLDWLINEDCRFSMAMSAKIDNALKNAPVILEANE